MNNFSKKNKDFKRPVKSSQEREEKLEKSFIKDIKKNSKNTVFIFGKINRIAQTGGPTVFVVSDGTGSLSLKGFVGAGQRAYPEITEGDSIKTFIKIEEFQGETEGNIIKINKLNPSEEKDFIKSIENIERERAKVIPPKFLVESPILNKLKDSFIKAATEIKLAIIQDRPIIVRHHNDTDGYSSGFSLERAILPLIEEQHGSEKSRWEFFTRAPCAAPFYEIDDSIRDTAQSLRNVARFSNKMPLIIIADNGSHFSAGMLCSELARFINPNVKNINQIPAMSGFADRIELSNPKTMNDYLKIAEKEGYTKELLSDIALVIEYVSSKIRFMEVREYIEVLFGEPRNKQKELVQLMAPYIKKMDKKGLAIGMSNAKQEKMGNVILQSIEIEETFPGFGFFPKPGRATGLVHDEYQKRTGETAVVTAGIMNTAITMRATDEANFSVHELIKFIDKKLPETFVEGGGHKNAGSISFLPNKKNNIVNLLKEFIKSR